MKNKLKNKERAPWEDEDMSAKKAAAVGAGETGDDDAAEDEADDMEAGVKAEAEVEIRKAAKGARKAAKRGRSEAAATPAKGRWQPRISYRWIMNNIAFFLFLAGLAVVYIYNGHYADKIVRDINRTNRELKELQYEYKTLKSEVMFRSKQSELAKAVEPFGLKELAQPPMVLTDSIKN